MHLEVQTFILTLNAETWKGKRKAGPEVKKGEKEKNHPHPSCACIGVVNSLFAGLLELLIILLCR